MTNYGGNGRRIITAGPEKPTAQIAAPVNDLQLVALMAACLAPQRFVGDVLPDGWQQAAVVQALEVLGQASFAYGTGQINNVIATAMQAGREAAEKAANEAEAQPPESPKLIVEE
jgi:hypothetical protein